MNLRQYYSRGRDFLFAPDTVFYAALVIGVFCTIITTVYYDSIFPDTANVYARSVRYIADGDWQRGIVVRVPMFNILLAGLLAKTGLEAVNALTLLSGIFYCAACFPLRKFLERYVTRPLAAWGCVLYVTTTLLIHYACSPLLESSRIFFMISAIYLFFETLEHPDWKKGALFGVCCGCLMTTRGEGFPAALALLGGFLPWGWLFCRQGGCKKQAVIWSLSVVCTIAAVAPFCVINHSKSGYFVTDVRMLEQLGIIVLGANQDANESAANEAARIQFEQSAAKLQKAEDTGTVAAVPEDKPAGESVNTVKRCIQKILNMSRDVFYGSGGGLYLVMAVLGFMVFICQKKLRWDYLLLMGMLFLHMIIYWLMVSDARYYLFVIPLFMMFTITGFDLIRQLAVKYLPQYVLVIGCALCGYILYKQVDAGIARTFFIDGKIQKSIGAFIEEYGKKHCPDRQLRVASSIPATVYVYWSKTYHVNGYERLLLAPEDVYNCDMMIIEKDQRAFFDARGDLEPIPDAPYPEYVTIYRKKQ